VAIEKVIFCAPDDIGMTHAVVIRKMLCIRLGLQIKARMHRAIKRLASNTGVAHS